MLNKKLISFLITIPIVFSFTACESTDIIGNTAIKSFNEVLNAIKISKDDSLGAWTLTAPDESTKFIWACGDKALEYDAMLTFSSKPFVDAGLDVKKLPEKMVSGDNLIVGTKFLNNLTSDGNETAISSFEKIEELARDHIKYHSDLDHFGVSLDSGNVFEFAKDMTKNDKDIVFVLNPQVFIDAGVNPENVEGWVYSKVKIMESNGKTDEIYKFLKPFNLK